MRIFEDIAVADEGGRVTVGPQFAGKPFTVVCQSDGVIALAPIHTTLRMSGEIAFAISILTDDWDGFGSLAPSEIVIAVASRTLSLLEAGSAARGILWSEPHVGVNELGEILMEWWRAHRTLTLFVRNNGAVEYLRSWGANIVTEMEDGKLTLLSDFVALYRWLYEGDIEEGCYSSNIRISDDFLN